MRPAERAPRMRLCPRRRTVRNDRRSATWQAPASGSATLPRLVRSALAALLLIALAACAGVDETADVDAGGRKPKAHATQPTTGTEAPMASGPAVVLPSDGGVTVSTVCVSADVAYPVAAPSNPPHVDELVGQALDLIGLSTAEPGDACDADLVFDLEGHPLSDDYGTAAGWVTQYSGAHYVGTARFDVNGQQLARLDVEGRLNPPWVISREYPGPSDAPYGIDPLVGPLLATFGHIWGPEAAVGTLPMWPFNRSEDVAEWVVGAAPDVADRLLEFRLASDDQVAHTAYLYLGEIVAAEAVPVAEQSAIVRTLVADIDDPAHPAGDALRTIAVPGLGFFEGEDGLLEPWDAAAWTAWADAEGY